MSARLARTIFASATRRTPTSVPLSVGRVSRRTMSATSHASAKSSGDTPWMIGSLLVFGPALLYLLSPSAKKNTHGVHNDHRDFPALQKQDGHQAEPAAAAPVEILKDDEGTEANVASSIALSEESDVPNDSTSTESNAETLTAAKTEEVPVSEEPATTSEPEASEGAPEGTEKSETSGEEAPTDVSKA